jgi:hypothetical protein
MAVVATPDDERCFYIGARASRPLRGFSLRARRPRSNVFHANLYALYALEKIQNGTLRLTSVAQHFGVGQQEGCAGLNDIPRNGRYPADKCPVKRDHLERSGKEGIKFPKPKSFYELKMGE